MPPRPISLFAILTQRVTLHRLTVLSNVPQIASALDLRPTSVLRSDPVILSCVLAPRAPQTLRLYRPRVVCCLKQNDLVVPKCMIWNGNNISASRATWISVRCSND